MFPFVEVVSLDRLRICIKPGDEWEVPGDLNDAVCTSDEEETATAAASSLRSFLNVSSSKPKPSAKRQPRATRAPGRGCLILFYSCWEGLRFTLLQSVQFKSNFHMSGWLPTHDNVGE